MNCCGFEELIYPLVSDADFFFFFLKRSNYASPDGLLLLLSQPFFLVNQFFFLDKFVFCFSLLSKVATLNLACDTLIEPM